MIRSVSADAISALAGFPLAELHVHIEGTLEPELVFELAARNSIELPWPDVAALRAQHEFGNLSDFLDLYYSCMAVLRTAEDFRALCAAYLRRAVRDGVRHAEVFFDPQAHQTRGVPIDTVLDGLLAGFREVQSEADLSGGLILCFLRDRPVAEAAQILDDIRPRVGDILGVGLDSAELGYPPSLFADVFAQARQLGLHVVAHAGEEGPAAYVEQSLDVLHAERIDHGVAVSTSPALIERLRRDRIPLTMCPLSNRRLQVTPDLAVHPLAELLNQGVLVTVNSDDPAYFGGYLLDNFAAAIGALALSPTQVRQLAQNAIDAAFLDPARRTHLTQLGIEANLR
jgi:adenosine deaminase